MRNVATDLQCLPPSRLNPHTSVVQGETLRWASDRSLLATDGLRRRAEGERCAARAGRSYPTAPRAALQVIADWTSWLSWHDARGGPDSGGLPDGFLVRYRHLLALLRGATLPRPEDPFGHALCDLRDRVEALAPDDLWTLRFVLSVSDCFEARAWEAECRGAAAVPASGAAVVMRRYASGAYIALDFIELANGFYLPPHVRRGGDLWRLDRIAADVVCGTRDLAAEVHAFEAAARGLPRFDPELDGELGRYVAGLDALMRADLDGAPTGNHGRRRT